MNNDAELPLGDPTARAFQSDTPSQVTKNTSTSKSDSLRPGDTGLGRPNPEPLEERIRILSEAEQVLITDTDREELEDRFNTKFSELSESLFKVPESLINTGRLILILLSGILGLFMLSEAISILRNISALPAIWQYIIIGAGIIFTLLIISVVIRLFLQLFGLRQSPQLNLKALEILDERATLQLTANKHAERARTELKSYLADYPLDNYPLLYSAGLTTPVINELKESKESLLNPARPLSAQDWLHEFQDRFQSPVEKVARERIRRYAGRVALGTAASPAGVVDQIIVLYGSLGMIKDILTLYNLRPAFGQSVIMLSRAIMQAYLSGMLAEATESGVETLSESYEEWTGELLAGSLTSSLKTVFAKTAEAGLNGFLLWRLGKATISHVQMIKNTK